MNAQQLKETSKTLEDSVNKYYWYTIHKESCSQIIVYGLASKFLYGKVFIQVTPIFGVSSFWVDKKKHLREIDNPSIIINHNNKETVLMDNTFHQIKLSPFNPNLNIQGKDNNSVL